MGIEYLVFVLFCFAASLVSAVFGFGTALIVLGLGSWILPVKEVLALATVLFASSTLLKTALFRQSINWRVAAILSIASFPFAYLGASLVMDVPATLLRQMLGLMIILYVLLTRYNWMPSFKINTAGLLAGSAAYGFTSGLLGSGNIIKAIMFREMSISKEAFVGAMAATSVLANVAKLGAFTQSGLLHVGMIQPITGLALAAGLAVLLGRRWLQFLSTQHFELGLQWVLLLSAIGLLTGY